MRTESPKPMRNGGWLHRLSDPLPAVREKRRPAPAVPPAEIGKLALAWRANVTQSELDGFAKSLGVSDQSLIRLLTGNDGEAWTFPMRDANGRIIGIRRRLPNGRKLSFKGGHEGVFYDPQTLKGKDCVLLPEGPTDTAALLTLGFTVIGRPSCLGGRELVKQLVGRSDCVVITDADEPGRRGARLLAKELKRPGCTVKVIQPPSEKDIRAYIQKRLEQVGPLAMRIDIESLIENSSVM